MNDDSENKQLLEVDKLDLDLTLAIIDDNHTLYGQLQRQLRSALTVATHKVPEHVVMPMDELKGLRGSIFRQLISRSLQTAIQSANEDAVKRLLKFATKHKMIVHVCQHHVDCIVDQRNYNIMAVLAKHSILLRVRITKPMPLLKIAFQL